MAARAAPGDELRQLAQTYPQLACQLTDVGWSSGQLAATRSAFLLAGRLFSGAERGSGKPFIDHLVGTASGVLLGGGNSDVVAAALLHAAYDQGDFGQGRTGAQPDHRAAVRTVVGSEIEELVFRYQRLAWSPDTARTVLQRVDDAPESERAVLLMRVANEIDDALDGGLVLSGKDRLQEHAHDVHEAVVALADHVGSPELARLAREVLLAPPRSIAPELIVGGFASKRQLPLSAAPRLRVRALRLGERALRSARRRLGRRVSGSGTPRGGA